MTKIFEESFYSEMLNRVNARIYITDAETDEIVYLNDALRQIVGLKQPEGSICWKIFGNGREGRCRSCPMERLLQAGDGAVCQTRVRSMVNGHVYQNYDSLIQWQGKKYHIRHSVDITAQLQLSQHAGIDELTGVMDRGAGKEKMRLAVETARKEGRALVAALLDADNLRQINEYFGMEAGDQLLIHLVDGLKAQIQKPDFLFRVSGDEFALVSQSMDEREVSKLLEEIRKEQSQRWREQELPCELSFSYGLYTVWPDESLAVNGILAKADERMYVQKLRRRKSRMLKYQENPFRHEDSQAETFEYDSTLLYDALINSTDDFIYICNMKTGVFRYSPAQAYLFDLPGEIVENPLPIWKKIVHPDDWARFYKSNMEIGENRMDYHSVEFRAKNRNGEYQWLRCRGQLMRDEFGEPSMFTGIMTLLGRQNKIDHLTQLLNDAEFLRVCDEKLSSPNVIDSLGIMILEIDDFRQASEDYDRSAEDGIFKTAAQSIQSILPDNGGLFRLDGDCLGVLLDNVNRDEVFQLFQEIQELLGLLTLRKDYPVNLTVSAGCVMYPDHRGSATELSQYANYALRYAKEQGANQLAFFSRVVLENRQRSVDIMMGLRGSMDQGFSGFSLRFQPQVDAKSKRIIGAEALLRWTDPEGAFVSPAEFVPILEESGMIVPVGQWVLTEAMKAAKSWLGCHPDFTISVNVSALQLQELDFVESVLGLVEEAEFPYENLILELTESHSIQSMEILDKKFEGLRQKGIRIAMDDFGTGYSSMERLKLAPIDLVKIDRAFVRNILNSKFDVTFIQFVVAICHDVGIQVCLEGMETAEEYEVLRDMDLDCIQGYLFGKPLTEAEFAGRLEG